MQRKENSLPFFITFFVLSILLILLGESGFLSNFSSFINKSVSPVRSATFGILSLSSLKNKTIENLDLENQSLRKQLVDRQNLVSENKALKDQFAISSSNSQSLLPAKVIGTPGFIPGVSLPQFLIIDKGSKDALRIGSTIVVGNYLVGRVISLTSNNSKIELVTNKNSSFTAKIVSSSSEVVGVVKGQGNSELVLDNVLLTQTLKKDELVLTKGDSYPPDLIIGKIISIDKKPSSLFQKASVKSFVNFVSLEIVFVMR